MTSEIQGQWPYGERAPKLHPAFKDELNRITVGDPEPTRPDGSPTPGHADRIMLRRELMTLMKAAHAGTVRDIEYEQVRDGDVVVELKFPRPGNRGGWHFRLYTGVPKAPAVLVWVVASRKPDERWDHGWNQIQNEHIRLAVNRFKEWITDQFAAQLRS
ncbi:hypothetical protein ACQPXH_01775 [Nocardia sp. CA-135953]|uniref:hypothetical protein n=1 Tax=Nocardia sp. CA-135953 TaxID=3239978 RepID=UPI003D97C789